MPNPNDRKQIHINLWTDEQVADYEYARETTGITNDNDLVRFLFRRFRLQGERVLIDTPAPYSTEPVNA